VFRFTYDPAGHLTGATRDGAPYASYAYDANGNRVSSEDPGRGAQTATFDGRDRLQSAGGTTYEYDDGGRLRRAVETASGDATTYGYDAAGNLTGVELPDGRHVTYAIDALDRPVARRVDGDVTSRLVWAAQSLGPVAEEDANGDVRSRFVYGSRAWVPDYMERDGHRYRLVTDVLGSVRAVVDSETGDVAQRLDYDPYGRVLRDTQPGFQPFGFAGGLADPDTGLVHFGARHYDPQTGRWTTVDPIDFEGEDTNLYAYAFGDPVNSIDPTGLFLGIHIGDVSNCAAGFGDSLSFGLTQKVRKKMGTDGVVDPDSKCYKAGSLAGDLYPTKRISGAGKLAKKCLGVVKGGGGKKRIVVRDGKVVHEKPKTTAHKGDPGEQRRKDREFADKVRKPHGEESKRTRGRRAAFDSLKAFLDHLADVLD
jgi:RHS repeat-associated protein